MRVYGYSPLYSYVELLFRCKRMFIVAILLGTCISVAFINTRKTMYEASMLINLSSDPTKDNMAKVDDKTIPPQYRKARRLIDVWLPQDPSFLSEVVKETALDREFGGEADSKTKEIRNKITIPQALINGQYLSLSITWDNPKQAETILNGVYSKFTQRTVAEETLAQQQRKDALVKMYDARKKDADKKGEERLKYRIGHFMNDPTMMANVIGRINDTQQRIAQVQFEIGEAKSRLQIVDQELAITPKVVESEVKTTTAVDDTSLKGLQKKYDDLADELKTLQNRYAEAHPQVVAKKKEVDEALGKLETEKKKPVASKPQGKEVTRSNNPAYQSLVVQRAPLLGTIKGLERTLAELQKTYAENQVAARQIPIEEKEFVRIENEWKLADNLRAQMLANLKAAEIDAEHATITEQKQVSLQIEPKAEKIGSASKTLILYVLGPILGIIIAFCLSLLAETLDHTIRTPVDVEKYLGKPVLAVIPKMKSPGKGGAKEITGASKPEIMS